MKVLAALYPDDRPEQHPDVPVSAARGLDLRERLADEGHELVTTSATGDGLDRELADAEVLVTTPFWPVYLDRDRIAAAGRLRLVITAGVGSDHVDVDAATAHGVTVTEVTGSNVVSVAEHNVLQILALVRNFVPAHRQAVEGQWDVAAAAQEAHDLEGKTVGLLGLGAIGARTALRLKPFDVTMLYHTRSRRSPAEEATLGVRYARLDHLVRTCDVVCVAMPLTAQSSTLFDADRLATMKRGAWLVNTARGAIADAEAVREACASGQLGGYAGDTWYPQPAPADHPWRAMPRHAMTIHYSGMTVEAQERIVDGVREILDAHLTGQPVPDDYVVAAPTD
ncbi:NAD-dependent formate dehydrogenase [Pseudonocardia sp. NPDC049635]|uniref:NAD-dependent formate dehydrogenase n=1 Tax=Pseudonocardia sp. NPDC049635 TaxID=3155506 RepID=UPI0033E07C0E